MGASRLRVKSRQDLLQLDLILLYFICHSKLKLLCTSLYFMYSIIYFCTSRVNIINEGRDNVVDITTRYGVDGPEVESLQGRDFPHPSRPVLEPNQPFIQWVRVLFRGKAARAWR